MAKIDVKMIEGYDAMSAEDKIKALETYVFPDPDMSGYVKKETFDKAASEVAEWKRKYNAQLSEEDQKKAARDEELETIRQERDELKARETKSRYKAKYLALGYSEELADATAQAMVDDDPETIFANQKLFIQEHDRTAEENNMKNTPRSPSGEGTGGKDYGKLIEEANARGDYASVAALYRMMQEAANT